MIDVGTDIINLGIITANAAAITDGIIIIANIKAAIGHSAEAIKFIKARHGLLAVDG
ncbi:hypothetical protein SHDE107825_19295 [Shewanella denitrificans]